MSITVKLPDELEHELAEAAKRTKLSKSFIVREAIKHYLEDLNDYHVGIESLRNTKRTYSTEKIRKELGLDD